MSAAPLPTTTVVIPTCERPQLAADAVRSVLDGMLAPFEVVVVDQSAVTDPVLTTLAAEHSAVRVVGCVPSGLSRARTRGVEEARGEAVAFLDDDELAAPGWLRALAGALHAGGRSTVVTGRVVAGTPERPGAFVPATALGEAPAVFRGVLDHDVLAGGNMAAWRTVLERFGFDERLGAGADWPAAEDNDLGLRLLHAGFAIAYVPEAVATHRAWRPGRAYPAVRWSYGLGKGGFYAKHARLDGHYGWRRAARDVGKRLPRAVLSITRPRFAAGELAYAAGIVLGGARWFARREGGERG